MKTIAEQLNHDFEKGSLFLYDSNNNQIYYENSYKFWSKQEFDSNGNQIYYENSYKFWSKQEFDSNGNQIYFENSNEYWYKREYDSNGNVIYYENSNEYWYKREYDSNSNLIYSENSYGNIEDHRPKESCEGKVDEWVEEIYTNELQNTNGRETPDEMFKKGIRAAIENTLTDKGLREAAEEYLNVVNNAMSFDNMVEYHKTAKAARYEMQKALNQNK